MRINLLDFFFGAGKVKTEKMVGVHVFDGDIDNAITIK